MRLFTSESVTIGHPDKLCDRISDAVLDAYLAKDPAARVAVETMATASGIVLAGEVSSTANIDRTAIAHRVLNSTGYAAKTDFAVLDFVTIQSPEIGAGVTRSLEARNGSEEQDDAQGAGDQGIMFGYATDETPELMPAAISLAHQLSARLTAVRKSGKLAWLRPDGKTQVTVGLDVNGRPLEIETVLISAQHSPRISQARVRDSIIREVVTPVIAEARLFTEWTETIVNPSGSFIEGGPEADTGLTGRKIIVDTYGGSARHGGGAFSGKDPSKVDRSAAYALRWIAKHVVAAGLAQRCEIQVAYAIGQARPVGLYVETFGTERVSVPTIEYAIGETFDLRPAAIIRDLDLLRPQYEATAANGHFGNPDFTWEKTPRLQQLRLFAGLPPLT
jgi:S-adenosylmethionine synthetase